MERIRIEIPARLPYAALLRTAVLGIDGLYEDRPHRPDAKRLYAWSLAVYEATTNIIRHGYAGANEGVIIFTIAQEAERVTFELHDQGRPNQAWPTKNPMPEGAEGGYGLHVIERVMDEVNYDANATGWNILRLVGNLNPIGVGPPPA